MNLEKLQQLQDEIQQEMRAALNNSTFTEILAKYGISGNGVLKFQCTLDLEEMQVNEAEALPLEELIKSVPEPQIVLKNCTWCIPCPGEPWLPGCLCCP